jgi:SAM-dependent methyltransferase
MNPSDVNKEISKFYDNRGTSVEIPLHIEAPYEAAYAVLKRMPDGGRLLEIGCGTGPHSVRLAEQGWSVVGIDISRVSLEAAHHRAQAHGVAERCQFIESSVEDYLSRPVPEFDAIFMAGVLYYLPFTIRRDIILKLLKPSGQFVFVEPLGENPLLNIYRRLRGWLRKDRDPASLNSLLRLNDVNQLAPMFDNHQVRGFDVLTLLGVILGAGRWAKTYHQVAKGMDDMILNRLGLRRFGFKVLFIGQGVMREQG